MKKECILVNTARGGMIDEKAMVWALKNKKIYGAGLDVFLEEPNIDQRYLKLDNVFIQPHQASATIETRKVMGELQYQNIATYFEKGKPLTLIPEMK